MSIGRRDPAAPWPRRSGASGRYGSPARCRTTSSQPRPVCVKPCSRRSGSGTPAIMPAGHDTHLLLRAFADELARCGVRDACTSPGSRCSPLVLALVRDGRLRCHSHIDERCSGFFAVGAAKAAQPAGGDRLHVGHRGGEPRTGRDRGVGGARAARRAHRRPPARAARGRRRPGDRPAQAVRRAPRSGSSTSARTTPRPSACAGCGCSPAAPCGRRSRAAPARCT